MALYNYIAVNQKGEEIKGSLEGISETEIIDSLKKRGLFPTKISISVTAKTKTIVKTKPKSFWDVKVRGAKIPKRELIIFTRQLAILLDAGLPLVKALRTLERQSKIKIVRIVIGQTADFVESGITFSESLSKSPKTFDKLYVNMIKAGESAGALETILDRLATFMEKTARIIAKVKTAMVYPAVVITVAVLITSMLMIFIVPKFKSIFNELLQGMPLPALTVFVIKISDILMYRIHYVFTGIIGFIVLLKIFKRTRRGAYWIDYCKFHMPLLGNIIAKSSVSRFARTLGTLLSSGVPILNAVQIVKDAAPNQIVRNAVQVVNDAIKEGEGLSAPLKETKVFPDMVVSMMEVGEETGKMPEMLIKVADVYDDEVDNAIAALTSIIEPLMIVGMAVIVGTIVIGMFLPLIKIMQTLGSS